MATFKQGTGCRVGQRVAALLMVCLAGFPLRSYAGPYDVVTPGWAQERDQTQLLERAAERGQLLVVIRSADQYKTDSRRAAVNAWAQLPVFRPAAKLRLPTSTSSNPVYKALRPQLKEPTGAPDLWLATADLKLLAYVPYPGGQDPEEAVQPALAQAAELYGFYTRAQRSLAFAQTQAEAGRIGIAWPRIQDLARQDARINKALNPTPPGEQANTLLPSLPPLPAAPAAPGERAPAYEDPGPGYFFGDLFQNKLREYEAIAQQRIEQALTALEDGDPVAARRIIAPMLQRPMQLPVMQEARQIMAMAAEVAAEQRAAERAEANQAEAPAAN